VDNAAARKKSRSQAKVTLLRPEGALLFCYLSQPIAEQPLRAFQSQAGERRRTQQWVATLCINRNIPSIRTATDALVLQGPCCPYRRHTYRGCDPVEGRRSLPLLCGQ
jgi:hypothetical protein